ncbi:hypothetical protein LTR53_008638 [Teratosphaeriaceae sp. CCFEE 6253]|nr:hypothetical protein LTR53_008638 [Teratosphaeriaceae sp. CCFEE 6253]
MVTTDGTITTHRNAGASHDLTYANEDPRSWRDRCDVDTHPMSQAGDDRTDFAKASGVTPEQL